MNWLRLVSAMKSKTIVAAAAACFVAAFAHAQDSTTPAQGAQGQRGATATRRFELLGLETGDKFTVHKVEHESAQAAGENAEEEGLAEFDLDSKGTIEITEVRENAAKAKITGVEKGVIKKGDAVRWVKQ